MSTKKQYGLVLSKKAGATISKTNVFNQSDSDNSDEGGRTDWVKKSFQKTSGNSQVKREVKIAMEKALKEDSTVYLYDEIYDKMEQKKVEAKQNIKEKEKKPKYIENLLQTSEKRKRENERRIERQVQKEREAEGEKFKDKEVFITSAYRKKLEDMAKQDEEERRQDMLEEIGDVTKQEDISGFYRHLYQTTVSDKEPKVENAEKNSDSEKKSETKLDQATDSKLTEKKKSKDNRNYRKRKQSESSTDGMLSTTSSSSSCSSSESEDVTSEDEKKESNKENPSPPKIKKSESNSKSDSNDVKNLEINKKIEKNSRKSPQLDKISKDKIDMSDPKAMKKSGPDISIWQKRTVGTVFDAALKRYLERKTARQLTHG